MERRKFIAEMGMGAAALIGAGASGAAPAGGPGGGARRMGEGPIIRSGMDGRMEDEARRYGYVNINGPSLVRVPAWVRDRLGKYYLYFAHHKGAYIRLACADELTGPWRVYGPGALELAGSFFPVEAPAGGVISAFGGIWKRNPPVVAWALTRVGLAARRDAARRKDEGDYGSGEDRPHIASPEVLVDEDRREFRMYYHGMLEDQAQMTRVAVSPDGINFQARPDLLAGPYLRVFRWREYYYGIGMPGVLYRSPDGLVPFAPRAGLLFGVNLRHTAVLLRGDNLYIFFSRVGDEPERILLSVMDVSADDWRKWKPSAPLEVLRPETPWEGADLPLEPSRRGEITVPANQLRDPAIFEENGQVYLLYACAGEQGIAIAGLDRDGF